MIYKYSIQIKKSKIKLLFNIKFAEISNKLKKKNKKKSKHLYKKRIKFF